MNQCPSYKDWAWFGSAPFEQLAKCGTDEGCSDWIHGAYCWLYNRLSPSRRKDAPKPIVDRGAGPPSHWTPFLGAMDSTSSGSRARKISDSGAIGFLDVDATGRQVDENHVGNKSLRYYANRAARYVYDLFRTLDCEIGFPEVEIFAADGDGSSLSFSAMIAAMTRILNISLPPDLVATGSIPDLPKGKIGLVPVAPNTLTEKIIAADRYGYQKFFVIQGQEGPNHVSGDAFIKSLIESKKLPADTPLHILEAESDPILALFRVLREIPNGTSETAQLLALFDKQALRSAPYGETDHVRTSIQPFMENSSTLVRHVAADILCRRALHLGQTREADQWRKETPPLSPSEFPTGWLGSYLKYEEAASKSVLNLDIGIWDDRHPDHRRADRILTRLKGQIKDDAAGIEEVRVAMALANTKARRLRFLGRLNRSSNEIKQAWEELIAFKKYWSEIFAYTEKRNMKDETYSRQRNQCWECLLDYRHWSGKNLSGSEEFVRNIPDVDEITDAFALSGWLHAHLIGDTPPTDTEWDAFTRKADQFYEGWKGYPNFLPYEQVLIYRCATEKFRLRMREQLAMASHLKEWDKKEGAADIMSLLTMRTFVVLGDFQKMESIRSRIPTNSPLRIIANRLSDIPDEIIYRAPY